ncbi:YeeE/YedE family protein [Cesiribacter andamanensis]|uniref:Putative transporter component n=1 Tax=Cesiribacter andamanensis AMV16 TaxID=1279009 RepID=M7NNP5_9BACT|nr:YeeE/YedE thiosulfate transporter family protein [Cesiribacter andamanensis]EMR03330.1 putative transporter component [Cesiribacter andamanensis AMV16]
MLEFVSQPWPWYVAGPLIALTMFLLLFFGKNFGVSSTLRTGCAIGGAGKINDFFDFNWKSQIWNLVFVGGMVVGGFIAATWLQQPDPIPLAPDTVQKLQEMGITNPGEEYLPSEIFSWEGLFTLRGFILLVIGGFLVGFGARYAGGCTSGHAISGLSDLQLPSLIAVIGFFIGGLLMTYLFLPLILQL